MPGKTEFSPNNTALLIIDMINDFNYPEGKKLSEKAYTISQNILNLKKKAGEKKYPIIYVNDNFGKWKSDFNVLINHCINDNTTGKDITIKLRPDKEDYFVLKPKHSAFHSTTLDLLLKYLNVQTLIITGIKTESCILSTAIDAYMRDYSITLPVDCIAGIGDHQEILNVLNVNFKCTITWSANISL